MQFILNSSSPSVAQQYIYNHILNTAGWFSGSERSLPHFNFTFSPNKVEGIQRNSEIDNAINLDNDLFNFLLERLSCRDTRISDDEPEPIFEAGVDLLISQYQQDIISFCVQHKIPFISKMPWPEGLPFAFIITHDIDMIRKYGIRSLFKDVCTAKFSDFADHYKQSVFGNNIYWNFNELLDFYSERKLRSSFFFIARAWENLNYRYRIESGKFRNLFDRLQQDQHEIGLHSSRYAFDQPQRISKEKEKIHKICGAQIKGIRQHYLRLTFPQAWRDFQSQGFEYDSSGGYNEAMGYRAGSSFPFRTYDIQNEEILKIYEIPFNVMDYPWEDMTRDSSRNSDLFNEFVAQIESTHGLLHILWHPHNLAEPAFDPLWKKIFTWLENKRYYNDSLVNILDWWKRRSGIQLIKLTAENASYDFILKSEYPVHNLCLQIISPYPLQLNSNLNRCKPDHQLQYQLKVSLLKTGIHKFSLPFIKQGA